MRRHFTDTYATSSAASYLIGIGDRHLENFLIDTVQGTVVPIDFGHAFGTAVMSQIVPELVPFRMTPQVQRAMGLLGHDAAIEPMITTLSALRRERAAVWSVLRCFLMEPLAQWERSSSAAAVAAAAAAAATAAPPQQQQQQQALGAPGSAPSSSSSSSAAAAAAASAVLGSDVAQQRLDIVRRKLDLDHPAAILFAEVSANAHVRPFLDRIRATLEGQPQRRRFLLQQSADASRGGGVGGAFSSAAPRLLASVEEQVLSLMEIATDTNILGRQWAGWMPLF